MNIRFIQYLLLGAVCVGLAAGCGKKASDPAHLRRYYISDPDTLNPVTASDTTSRNFQRHIYEPLAQAKYGAPTEFEPLLAEKWEFDKDNLEYTIHLRKGVKWHPMKIPGTGAVISGKEFTSRDAKFSFDCAFNRYTTAASLRSYLTDTDPDTKETTDRFTVEVVDDYTLKIKWAEPFFMADDITLNYVHMIPRHIFSVDENGKPITNDFSSQEFGKAIDNHWAGKLACGSGPMMLTEWKKEESVKMVRFDDYWGKPMDFEQFSYEAITNAETVRAKLFSQELDVVSFSEPKHYIDAKSEDVVKQGKVTMLDFDATFYSYIGYNLKNKLFEDKRVRMALSHATPVDTIIEDVELGLATRQTGPFMQNGIFADPSIKPIEFDIEKAKNLLTEAGWNDTDNNGVRDKVIDGEKTQLSFEIMIPASVAKYTTTCKIIQEAYKKAGVQVTIGPTKWAAMLPRLHKKEFDATILGWNTDWKGDPKQLWHSSEADIPDSSNYGYKNQEVDRLIDELHKTIDQDKQVELYHQIHQQIFADQPYTFLYQGKAKVGYNSRIENVKVYPNLRPHFDVREWRYARPATPGS